MKPSPPSLASNFSAAHVNGGFEATILRLVKGAPECRAIKAGEVDAIMDRGSGRAILLPAAQAALLEHKARFRSLVELSSDGYWEQDEQYRFVSHTGAAIGNAGTESEDILGKTLWDLPFDNHSEIDWQTHRTQLEWRAIFRDLEFKCVDRTGTRRIISISGEPMFDVQAQFKGYRGITRDITERKQMDTAVPYSNRFARETLDALATQVCVLDAAGTIMTANTAWRVFAAAHGGIGGSVTEGGNYLGVCAQIIGDEHMDAMAMDAGIRQVIAGEREVFRYEYCCDAPSGQRWFMATVTGLRGGGAARAIVCYEDIAEIKRTEQLLRLECAVVRSLADAGNASTALQAVIRAICESQHWDCGRYFRLDSAAGVLCPDAAWGIAGIEVERFMEKSRDVAFHPGAGLAGRVCQSGEPLWVLADMKDMNSKDAGSKDMRMSQTALAHETGMDGAFFFPVIAAGKVIGVLAFASGTMREPDERLLQAVRSIGNQLGQFWQRRQAEDALRQSELRFRRLTELSADWIWEQDTQFRFTKMTGAGMAGCGDMLGKALWELPAIVLSDEEWIKHKSELAARWSFCDFEYVAVLPDGQRSYYCISGEPFYDEAGVFTGFHGTGLDITRRKRAEIALREAGS